MVRPVTGAALQSKVTNRSTIILALIFTIVGAALFYVAGHESVDGNQALSAFLSQAGGLVLATGLLTLGWDLVGRRAFADEVLAKARLSADVVQSGLQRVTNQYLEEVEWSDLFRDVNKLDIVVAYASTWRYAHLGRLQAVAKRPEARIRVFLPDPDDPDTVRRLAERFSITEEALRAKIQDALEDFTGLAVPGGATVEVLVRKGDAVFSCYRFDSRAVLTLYSHSRERRTQVPTFVVAEGDLFQFVYEELVALRNQSVPCGGKGKT